MAHFIVPLFASEHYKAIRALLNEQLPDTYDEWLQLHSDEKQHIVNRGNTFHEVQIHPDDFARYTRTSKKAANLKTLDDFTREEAARKGE